MQMNDFFSIDNIISVLIEYKLITVFILISLTLFASTFYTGKSVKLKRKYISRNRFGKYVASYINKNKVLLEYRDRLARQLGLITQKNKKSNQMTASNLISIFIVALISITLGSFIFVPYILLKILIPVLIAAITLFIFNKNIESRRSIAKNDFPKVLSSFTSQYAISSNVLKTLNNCLPEIPYSHKYEFTRLITSMNSSTNYLDALNEYARRIDTTLCYGFIEVLKLSYIRNNNILYALIELEEEAAHEKANNLSKSNRTHDKKLNIYLAFACTAMFMLIVYFLMGDAAINLYFNTFIGQMLILSVTIIVIFIISVIAIVDKYLAR